MEFRTLKKLFDDGFLRSAFIVPAPMNPDNWNLMFVNNLGKTEKMTLARSQDVKTYRALQSALSDAQKVGFKTITVEYDKMVS